MSLHTVTQVASYPNRACFSFSPLFKFSVVKYVFFSLSLLCFWCFLFVSFFPFYLCRLLVTLCVLVPGGPSSAVLSLSVEVDCRFLSFLFLFLFLFLLFFSFFLFLLGLSVILNCDRHKILFPTFVSFRP